MPVEHIHIVHGQQIEELLHELDAEEMTRAVEMHASPREPRTVGDHHGIHDRALAHGLTQRLDAIEHTCRRTTLDGDTTLADSHHIAFFLLNLRRDGEFDITHLLGTLRYNRQLVPRHLLQILLQELGLALQLGRREYLHTLFKDKRLALLFHDTLWQGQHIVIGRLTRKRV